jgi:hypothetical protein
MAQTKEGDNGPIRPDFEKMKNIFTAIKAAEEDNAKARGELSGHWKAVEDDCHAHKGAAKALKRLHHMSSENRVDYLRTFLGGVEAFDWLPPMDLVDKMEELASAGIGDDGIDDD